MTRNKKFGSAEEMLRQSVFSSVHLSTRLKSDIVQLEPPVCSYCGLKKASAKKKPSSYHFCLYTNSSESFVVWFKKREEPKGILWLRSFTIRKLPEDNLVELAPKRCPFRCSYKLRLTSSEKQNGWFQLLRDESRRQPSFDNDGIIQDSSYLESILQEDGSSDTKLSRSCDNLSDIKPLDAADSDSDTASLSSSADSDTDKISCGDSYSVRSESPVAPQCTTLFSYLRNNAKPPGRNMTASMLPNLKVASSAESKRLQKSASVVVSPVSMKSPHSPLVLRQPLVANNSLS